MPRPQTVHEPTSNEALYPAASSRLHNSPPARPATSRLLNPHPTRPPPPPRARSFTSNAACHPVPALLASNAARHLAPTQFSSNEARHLAPAQFTANEVATTSHPYTSPPTATTSFPRNSPPTRCVTHYLVPPTRPATLPPLRRAHSTSLQQGLDFFYLQHGLSHFVTYTWAIYT